MPTTGHPPHSVSVGFIQTVLTGSAKKGPLLPELYPKKNKPLSHFLHGHPKDFFSPGRLTFESYPVLDATMGGAAGKKVEMGCGRSSGMGGIRSDGQMRTRSVVERAG